MVMEEVLTHEKDVRAGDSPASHSSVYFRSSEKQIQNKALMNALLNDDPLDLPYMRNSPRTCELSKIFSDFVDEFTHDIGNRIRGSPCNIRGQHTPVGARHHNHVDTNTEENDAAGIHVRGIFCSGGNATVTFQGHHCTPAKNTDDHPGKVVPHVKVVVNTSDATYYQTDIVGHGGTISSYNDEDRKSGIQVYHRVGPVKENRFVFVIDWIVKSIDDSCRSMKRVRKNGVIKMSDKLLLRFKEFIEKYKDEGDYVLI
jgi:hypothetical protein